MLIATGLSCEIALCLSPWRRARQDYKQQFSAQASRQSRISWQSAVEERDVLRRIEETGDPLVFRAMLLGYECRVVDLAVIADLGGIRVTLEQNGFRPRAGGAQRSEEKETKE